MAAEHYDVVVIGGGIQGTGVAQAAAASGHSVLLLEQTGLASGTSSRSSKLIHGGLRYLESAQFRLVHECLEERAILLKNAPDLVKLIPFYIPVYKATTRRPWQVRIGLTLYAFMGDLRKSTYFRSVPRAEWDQLDGLETDNLQAVYQYNDAQTDDAALTHAVMQSALELGAEIRMPASFSSAELGDRKNTVVYRHDDIDHTCTARVIVNASGPWANEVLGRITPLQTQVPVEFVQGAHIILEEKPGKGIYYMEAPRDRRAVFVIPWKEGTMVGTTETVYKGNPAGVKPLPEEIDYLLETAGHYFPRIKNLTCNDIVGSFAGLRVLPTGEGSAFSRPRETVFHTDRTSKPRVITLYGGKLTAYRITAEKVMKKIAPALPECRGKISTKTIKLT